MTRAQLDKQPREVAEMFDRTARRYDFVNDLISFGQMRLWRKAAADAIDAGPGEIVLDLGAGTGTSTEAFTGSGARAIASDFSIGMLSTGVRRRGRNALTGSGVPFIAGDPLNLPFADDVTIKSFDLVYREYLMRMLPTVGKIFGSNDDSYEYLAETIRDWHDQPALARLIQSSREHA